MRQDNPAYAGMVENVDENVGRIIQALKITKAFENTIIVLSSDHGGLSNSGKQNTRELATTNYPLRAGKGWLYEGGIRVPLFIKWGQHFKARKETKSIVLGMDVLPTLMDLALNAQITGLDGSSYKNVLYGLDQWDKRTVFWHERKARPQSTGEQKASAIRSGDYKLIHFFESDQVQLYNLKNDNMEQINLAQKMPAKTKELLSTLNKWKSKRIKPNKKNKH